MWPWRVMGRKRGQESLPEVASHASSAKTGQWRVRPKQQICLPCDTYLQPWENCRAIGKAVEGFRAMERNGTGQILEQAFAGFIALPPPAKSDPAKQEWWQVLGMGSPSTDAERINYAFKGICRFVGGATTELNAARDEGLRQAK